MPQENKMPEIHGHCDKKYKPLQNLFAQTVQKQGGGAALALYHHGEAVVDLWAGVSNEQNVAWQEDTLSISFSTSKGVTATVLHRLVDKGLIDYDAPIARYWPEFGANGKATITIRQMLCHQAGLHSISALVPNATAMQDWPTMIHALEQATPHKKLRYRSTYHGLTYGWIVGEVICRVTGLDFASALAQELSVPLALDGCYIGVPDSELGRLAQLMTPGQASRIQTGKQESGTALTKKKKQNKQAERVYALLNSRYSPIDIQPLKAALLLKGLRATHLSDPEFARASIPAANGAFTARSLAKMYAMLAGKGKLQSQRFLSPHTFQHLSTIQTYSFDKAILIPMQWRLGYHRILTARGSPPQGLGHFGYGGSGGWAEPVRSMAMGYTTNVLSNSLFGFDLGKLSRTALELGKRR